MRSLVNARVGADQLSELENLMFSQEHYAGKDHEAAVAEWLKANPDFAEKLKAKPGNYIAQPTLSLSTVPIMVKKGIAPRHVDLRPYVLVSDKVIDTPPDSLEDGDRVRTTADAGSAGHAA